MVRGIVLLDARHRYGAAMVSGCVQCESRSFADLRRWRGDTRGSEVRKA